MVCLFLKGGPLYHECNKLTGKCYTIRMFIRTQWRSILDAFWDPSLNPIPVKQPTDLEDGKFSHMFFIPNQLSIFSPQNLSRWCSILLRSWLRWIDQLYPFRAIGRVLADSSLFISCAMALATFNITKYNLNGETMEPIVDQISGTIRYAESVCVVTNFGHLRRLIQSSNPIQMCNQTTFRKGTCSHPRWDLRRAQAC